MYIKIVNFYGVTVFSDITSFDTFRGLVASGQKIQAIKFMREKEPCWSLKEAEDFVDYVAFPPVPVTTTLPPFDTAENFLSDLKGDLREIILAGKDYRDSLLIDLFGRVSGKLGYRY